MSDFFESPLDDYIAYRIFEEATRPTDDPDQGPADLDTLLERLLFGSDK